MCNYPYNNYAWQKALAFLGEGFPATTSLFCLALDLHRIKEPARWEGAQVVPCAQVFCAGSRWAPVTQRLQGNLSAPLSLTSWIHTAPSWMTPTHRVPTISHSPVYDPEGGKKKSINSAQAANQFTRLPGVFQCNYNSY